jgi:competence protein ComEA
MKRAILAVALFLLLQVGSALAAVDINTANEDALSQLPYIGEAKAAAIIKEREENGNFDTVDDLTRVNGIGSKTVDRLRDEATVDSSSQMASDEEDGSS